MRIGRSGSLAGGVFVLLAATATAPLGAQVTPGTAGSPAVITGRVQGEGSVALPAANVLIPEMNISVGTNEQGVYTITIAPELKGLGVEFLEQPLPREDWDGMRRVFRECALPVFADESGLVEEDVPRCAGVFHGINIKLTKAGGLTPARRMIARARELGL